MTTKHPRPNPAKLFVRLLAFTLLAIAFSATVNAAAQTSSLAQAGLRTVANQGQFNAVQSDASGNLYLLLDQHDGLRVLKTDPTATIVLAQTHLGAQGDIALALALDPSGNVYVTGTTASGSLAATPNAPFPTPTGTSTNSFIAKFDSSLNPIFLTFTGSGKMVAASIAANSTAVYITGSIPATPGATSGFLTKLSPSGDALLFSTFIPGAGLTSIALDPPSVNLLLTGAVDLGGFPIATVATPHIPTTYQTLLRLPLDGSAVLSSTLLAPGTQSTVTPAPNGTAWIAGTLTTPLLPVSPLSSIGNTFAAHVNQQNAVDQTARFGGLPTSKPTFASALANLTSVTTDFTGQPTFAGSIILTASSSLLATETFDLPLFNSPTTALPSILRDALPPTASCAGSICPGSAAYLARLSSIAAPSLALSYDAAPNLTLRNLGPVPATALSLTSSTFTLSTNCAPTLAAGAECAIALTGSGPGSITIQASNAPTKTIPIPAFTAAATPVIFSPKELDFGIQTSTSAPATHTITITNLTAQPQTFVSQQDTSSHSLPYTLTESSSDCPLTGPSTKNLAAGATCHITLSLTASSTPANDGLISALWTIGPASSGRDVLVTGYTQAATLSLSTSHIDFGTRYTGGLRQPRYLYLSNNSDAPATHAAISSPSSSLFSIADRCPSQLDPRTICQLQIDYLPTNTPSIDSTTLSLDEGLTTLLTGQSLPQPNANGTSVNPNLSVNPTTASPSPTRSSSPLPPPPPRPSPSATPAPLPSLSPSASPATSPTPPTAPPPSPATPPAP